jgi:hypothetical protein
VREIQRRSKMNKTIKQLRTLSFEIAMVILLLILFSQNALSPMATSPQAQSMTTSSKVESSGTIFYGPISPLHIDGRYIKNAAGNIVYLTGAGKWGWDDDPTGWWVPEGDSYPAGYGVWNETAVRANLHAMASWGLNVVRFHTVADWWIKDSVTFNGRTGSYRNNLERTFQIAAEEGMYVIMDLFSPVNGSWLYNTGNSAPSLPFPPYEYAEAATVLGSKQAFVNYWASVANETKAYPNVLFELYNEPNADAAVTKGISVTTARDDWFDATQKAITAIRNTGARNIVVVQWQYGAVPYIGSGTVAGDLSWIWAYTLDDPLGNILYSTHLYRDSLNPNWYSGYNYTNALNGMKNIKADYVVQTLNKSLIIGEIGADMQFQGQELQHELDWATNMLNISNLWGISYSVWDWGSSDAWHLLSKGTMIPPPSAWGQVLITAVAEANNSGKT